MFNIQNYSTELQVHMRCTAEQALALSGIARELTTPAVEQLNNHSSALAVLAAREAIVLTMVNDHAVEARFNEPA